MPRTAGAFSALGLVLVLLTGCAATDLSGFAFLKTSNGAGDQLIYADLETVSAAASAALSSLGLTAVTTNKGEAIHIASTTKNGARFVLELTRERSATGERTRARINWENGKDEAFAFELLARLVARQRG